MRTSHERGHGYTQNIKGAAAGTACRRIRSKSAWSPSDSNGRNARFEEQQTSCQSCGETRRFIRSLNEQRNRCQPLGGRIKPSSLSDGRFPVVTSAIGSSATTTSLSVKSKGG